MNRTTPGFVPEPDLDELRELVATPTELTDFPHATEVRGNVLVYDGRQLASALVTVATRGGNTEQARQALQAEWAAALADGPGMVVLAGAFDTDVVDRTSAAFTAIIEEQRTAGDAAGDHFAKPGANDRIWNALEKLAVSDPAAFVDYYGNALLAQASEAWLGPAYQVTSQVNVVNPGGDGQTVHRDYHLGFLDDATAARYPAHVHRLSPALTLQGAVAHDDMPVESGPTRYLPHSQKLLSGYLAWRRPDFSALFEEHQVQLPLAKGDAVFFNPALFHAAGANRTSDRRRMANLLQVSSAFGRAMEAVDRHRVVTAIYPELLRRRANAASAPTDSWEPGRSDPTEGLLDNVVAASAEGYPFPTNLDRDQPVGGLAPPSQADLVRAALRAGEPPGALAARLAEYADRRR
jgi:ectoine hydroxylase-related dioxygenase (phytanoyl-CoA dioxygenase family)